MIDGTHKNKSNIPDIFEKMTELGLQKDSYIVVGGGILVALGLLEWDDDIDIAVDPAVYENLEQSGEWSQEQWGEKNVLKNDVYDVGIGFGPWTLEELQSDSMEIQGIAFMSLTKIRQWKVDMGREKDMHHVTLIDDYLARNPQGEIS